MIYQYYTWFIFLLLHCHFCNLEWMYDGLYRNEQKCARAWLCVLNILRMKLETLVEAIEI